MPPCGTAGFLVNSQVPVGRIIMQNKAQERAMVARIMSTAAAAVVSASAPAAQRSSPHLWQPEDSPVLFKPRHQPECGGGPALLHTRSGNCCCHSGGV